MRDAGGVVTREQLIEDVWDMNWFGSTKTLDVHVSSLRKKLGDDPSEPRYLHTDQGRRVSVLVARRSGAVSPGPAETAAERPRGVSLRTTLLAAFAYVLLLVIIVLEVPLGINISRRVDAEIKAEAAGQVQLIATTAADDIEQSGRRCRGWSNAPRSQLGGRVIVVDGRGRVLADSAGPGLRDASYASRPEIRSALRGVTDQGTRQSRARSARTSCSPRCRCSSRAARWARCGRRRASRRLIARSETTCWR